MWVKNDSKLSECCAPDDLSTPSDARRTRGTLTWPPNMYRNFAAWLMISSIAPIVNSTKLIDATGLIPVTAAPTAEPRISASEIGMSIIRSDPNSSSSPLNWPKLPPQPMSSPITMTVESSRMAAAVASTVA